MRGLWTEESKALAMEVAQGNPGALRVIDELLWFSDWFKMMQYCVKIGLIGPKLWEKYKDDFGQDYFTLGQWIQQGIATLERNMRRDALEVPRIPYAPFGDNNKKKKKPKKRRKGS